METTLSGSDAFCDLTKKAAKNLAARFGTPIYLFSKQALLERYRELKNVLQRHYPRSQIAYPYKTNPLRGLVTLLHREGAWAEVASEYEYALSKDLSVPGDQIVYNGPHKPDHMLAQAALDGACINVDHFDELARLESVARQIGKILPVGIRIHIVNDAESWHRFGFSWVNGDALEVAGWIHHSPHLRLAGVHAHIGTNVRNLRRFTRLGQVLNEFARTVYQRFGIVMDWINVGGGLAGISPCWSETDILRHPAPDIEAYVMSILSVLVKELPHEGIMPQIFFESGRTLLEPAGALLTQVVGTRKTSQNGNAYIINGGLNALPTARKYRHPIRAFNVNNGACVTSAIYGPLCLQADTLSIDALLPKLKIDDLLLFDGVGAYNVSRAIPFIQLRPGAVLWCGGNKAEWLRLPETLEYNQELERIPAHCMKP